MRPHASDSAGATAQPYEPKNLPVPVPRPSDVARIVGGPTWRTLLPVVRDRAVKMTESGELEILRRGRVVKSNPTEGVLRYRLTRKAQR